MMMRWLRFFLFVCAVIAAPCAHAVQPDEVLSDPALEARARALSQHLRCMVCQNQSIDDSDAPLARDLRLLVREQLKSGASDQQIVDFLVSRYGEFVLLQPRFNRHTLLLWLLPGGVLLAGVAVLLMRRRIVRPAIGNLPLTESERAKLSELLCENDPRQST